MPSMMRGTRDKHSLDMLCKKGVLPEHIEALFTVVQMTIHNDDAMGSEAFIPAVWMDNWSTI